jgi:hypothetical protein
MQRVENYEYEMPSDFEDEEIDEDLAFTAEDKKKYAGWFGEEPDDGADAGAGGSGDEQQQGSRKRARGEFADLDSSEEEEPEDDEDEVGAEGRVCNVHERAALLATCAWPAVLGVSAAMTMRHVTTAMHCGVHGLAICYPSHPYLLCSACARLSRALAGRPTGCIGRQAFVLRVAPAPPCAVWFMRASAY